MKTYPILIIIAVVATVALGSLVLVTATIQDEQQINQEIALNDEIKRTIYITIEDSVGSSDDLR